MLKVLVPTDGSSKSQHGIRHVISEFEKNPGLEVHVLNVQPPFSKHVSDFTNKSDRADFHREQADLALAPVRQALDAAGVPYTVHYEVGDKADCIVAVARRLACDCILMSTARKSSLVRLVEHSITNQVIERSTVPVEVIAGEPASKLERFGIPAGVGAGILVLASFLANDGLPLKLYPVLVNAVLLVVFAPRGILGLAGKLLGWALSMPPLALMSRGLGELAVGLAWGLMVVGADYVQRGQFALAPLAAGASYALLIANILIANGFPDAVPDALVGKRTLVVRLTPMRAAWLYLALALLAHGGVAVLVAVGVLPAPLLWALASLPLSLAGGVQLLRHADSPARLRPALVLGIAAAVLHGLGLAAGFWWT